MKKRNLVRQLVPIKDKETGEVVDTKVIWHLKKFSQPQYQSRKEMWQQMNQAAKQNSKRQTKLREEHGTKG